MLAFTDTPVTKEQLVAALEAHAAVDAIVQGRYWHNGKGCAVGCSLVKFGAKPDDHSAYERLFGVPKVLAQLEDQIFECLPADAAKEWPLRFAKAIRPGSDLSLVWPRFAVWLLTDPVYGVLRFANERGRKAIQAVADLYARQSNGEAVGGVGFNSAYAAANAAARAAAYAANAAGHAAYAAAYAAANAAAYAAAYAAADAAAAAAYAAAGAAYAAANAAAYAAANAAARAAAHAIQAEKLIELLETA